MQPTRQLGAVAGLVAVLALLAIVVGRPLVLGGAVLVGAWLLAQEVRFARDLERTAASLSVEQSPARTDPMANDVVPVTLVATLERPAPISLSIVAGLPPGAAVEESLAVSLEPGETVAERTVDVTWPVVGHHQFDETTVTASDGRFRETLSAGTRPQITVVHRGPRAIHVGSGGDRIALATGKHDSTRPSSGIEPAEIREYVPGDTARRIDWKATARFASPHVREFETGTERPTLLVVDHRATLSTGRPDRTKLDYLRGVALATIDGAADVDDPVGLLTVGDGGITGWRGIHTSPTEYRTDRRRLYDLEPTAPTESESHADAKPVAESGATGTSSVRRPTTTVEANRHLAALEGDDDAFAETLGPFLEDRRPYRERFESEPLYAAVRSRLPRRRAHLWMVIFTDDSRPVELRETVKLARASGDEVAVFLAPTVLYEPGGLADVERAYERYVDFERLRRDLARMRRVNAFEVGPGDRLATVLEAGRSRGGRS